MKIFYRIDERNLIYPCCDWREDIETDESWLVGDISAPVYEEHGIPLYKLVNGIITSRTNAEILEDIGEEPEPELTEMEQLRADVDYLLMLTEEE